jgi:hypothetical protein
VLTNAAVRKVVQVEYLLARTPLVLIDRGLAARFLPEDSKVRVLVERSLASLDAVAGRLLNDPAPPPRAEEPSDGARAHDEEPVGAPADEVQRVTEELLAEHEDKPVVGELADPDLDVAEVQAQLRAKHLVEEQAQRREQASTTESPPSGGTAT